MGGAAVRGPEEYLPTVAGSLGISTFYQATLFFGDYSCDALDTVMFLAAKFNS